MYFTHSFLTVPTCQRGQALPFSSDTVVPYDECHNHKHIAIMTWRDIAVVLAFFENVTNIRKNTDWTRVKDTRH